MRFSTDHHFFFFFKLPLLLRSIKASHFANERETGEKKMTPWKRRGEFLTLESQSRTSRKVLLTYKFQGSRVPRGALAPALEARGNERHPSASVGQGHRCLAVTARDKTLTAPRPPFSTAPSLSAGSAGAEEKLCRGSPTREGR